MKTLNLTDLDKSEIKYKISKFPDGQQNITIDVKSFFNVGCLDVEYRHFYGTVKIISHLNNWLDLELITCTVASFRELALKIDIEIKIHLVTPYFIGARSDRKFEEGGNWYLKQVICPIINNLGFASILVMDPHSWVLGNLLNNFKFIDNKELVNCALGSIEGIKEDLPTEKWLNNNVILISPDAGASHKIEKIAKAINYKGDIITCTKERDKEGNLTQVVVPLQGHDYYGKDFVIIDDICDGGRTFINIAKEIRENTGLENKNSKIYLIVTHGIFSNGISELGKYFDGIYCTNSYSNLEPENDGNDYIFPNLVEQLNVY